MASKLPNASCSHYRAFAGLTFPALTLLPSISERTISYRFTSSSQSLQIAESFRRFGIQDSTTSLLVLKVTTSDTPTASDIQSHLSANVEGNSVELSDETLEELTDKARVRKVYKINVNAGGGAKNAVVNGNGAGEKESVKLESDVLGVMALRGAA